MSHSLQQSHGVGSLKSSPVLYRSVRTDPLLDIALSIAQTLAFAELELLPHSPPCSVLALA
jgi:hypothetical protein